jgi:hypothetical protein
MTSRQRYSSFNCRARGQTEYSLERNTLRSSSKASHSNNVCWIVSDSRDSQQGHCALRTSCVRLLELRRSWQPKRNFVFNLRPSRRDAGHALSKYSGKPKRSFSAQLLMLRRVDISLKPSASSETRRDATNPLTNFFAANITKQKIRKTENESSEFPLGRHLDARAVSSTTSGTDCGPVDAAPRLPRQHEEAPPEAVEQRQAERHEEDEHPEHDLEVPLGSASVASTRRSGSPRPGHRRGRRRRRDVEKGRTPRRLLMDAAPRPRSGGPPRQRHKPRRPK